MRGAATGNCARAGGSYGGDSMAAAAGAAAPPRRVRTSAPMATQVTLQFGTHIEDQYYSGPDKDKCRHEDTVNVTARSMEGKSSGRTPGRSEAQPARRPSSEISRCRICYVSP